MRAARAGLAGAGGLLLYAGHPPIDAGLLGLVALAPLVVLGRSYTPRGAARLRFERAAAASTWGAFGWGLVAGLACFVPLVAWVKPFGFIAWFLLAMLGAVSTALFVWLVAAWGDRPLWPAVAVVGWVAVEVARSHWPFGGFTWGALGYTQHAGGVFLPVARVLGMWGVGAACATIGVALAAAGEAALQRRWRGVGVGGAVVVAVVLLGVLASLVDAPPTTSETVDIAAVQGNDLQRSGAAGVQRLDDGRIVAVAQAMLDATRPLAADPPDVTIWPENALDDDPRVSAPVRDAVVEALDLLEGGSLIAGALVDGPRQGTALNVAAEVVEGPRFDEVYVKRQTVPFAEYIPGRRFLEWFPPLRQIPLDILGAEEPVVITAAGVPLGVVICFENIFPDVVADQVDAGAELVVVSTNNASFGRTAMSSQHLAFSQLRAVETGRYVLHAGISGISGIVAPDGTVTQQTELYEEAIVRDDLPLVAAATPYLRIRKLLDSVLLVLGAVLFGIAIAGRLRRRSPADPSAGVDDVGSA